MSQRLGGLMTAAALFAAACLFVTQSLYLPFGRVGLPGPGFFPFALGLALAVFALAIFVQVLRGADADPVFIGHRDVLVVFAALIGVAMSFETLGAYLSLGGLVAILLLAVARSKSWHVALGAGLGMVAVWVVFKVLLGVQLPAGPF